MAANTTDTVGYQPELLRTSNSFRNEHTEVEEGQSKGSSLQGPDDKVEVRDINTDQKSLVDENPQGRQLGTFSAVCLIVNRIVGTGVFATTSTILVQGGSVGMTLIYFLIGGIIAALGFYVYAEFASALPRNGGEVNYLQHAYRRPKGLIVSAYASQALLLGQAAGNALTAGFYFLKAGDVSSEWRARGIGVGVILAAVIMHGCFLKWGLRFQNFIGAFKIVILLLIAFAGFGALAGHTKVPVKNNFANAFEGTRSDIYGIGICIYNGLWSFVGYSNAFYALGEVRKPSRVIRIAGPLALMAITVIYLLVQIAYFAAVSKEDIRGSEQIVAAYFFQNMFGTTSRKALSVFVAFSATANVFAVIFSQGRLVQALGRDDVIPFAKLFASNKPFNAPLFSIAWHAVVTLIIMLAPRGDGYNLVLNLSSYPLNIVNAAVGVALVAAYLPRKYRPQWAKEWEPPFRTGSPVAVLFTLASIFLVIVPWIPPKKKEDAVYASGLWYAIAPAISLGIFAAGGAYWLIRYVVLPRLGNYSLEKETRQLSDGTIISTHVKVPRH
ncbi:unnamed protein product [Parajaminaea phylloscopi]